VAATAGEELTLDPPVPHELSNKQLRASVKKAMVIDLFFIT